MHIRSTQRNWAEAREFARAFSQAHSPLPYRMQTQAVLTHEALMLLLRHQRVHLAPEGRAAPIASQNGRCAQCQDELGADCEVDHVQPLASFGDNSRANWAVKCPACHANKTQMESVSRLEHDPISSEFSPDVYAHFVESPKPKQMYINAREFQGAGPQLYVDVVRCRYNALYTRTSTPYRCSARRTPYSRSRGALTLITCGWTGASQKPTGTSWHPSATPAPAGTSGPWWNSCLTAS